MNIEYNLSPWNQMSYVMQLNPVSPGNKPMYKHIRMFNE